MKLSLVELFCSLRRQLVTAREQKNMADLEGLISAFIRIQDAADAVQDQVVSALAEDFENAARDGLMDVNWKSTIPSDDDLRHSLSDYQP